MAALKEIVSEDAIEAAWTGLKHATGQLETDPVLFVLACKNLQDTINDFHFRHDIELGSDDYYKKLQLLKSDAIVVNLKQAIIIYNLTEIFSTYSLHAPKRHDEFLNVGIREHLPHNELQSWFSRLRDLYAIIDCIQVFDGKRNATVTEIVVSDDDSILSNFQVATDLIDASEDYFIEVVLQFLYQISNYISKSLPVDIFERVKRMAVTIFELLNDREEWPIRRMEEFALLLAKEDWGDSILHKICIATFAYIPGMEGYSTLRENERFSGIQNMLSGQQSLYQRLERSIPSKLPTLIHPDHTVIISIQSQMAAVTQLDFNADSICREDFFLAYTLQLITDLCTYVANHPHVTMIHDRHHQINTLLRKACKLLFERDTNALSRFKTLALSAILKDKYKQGEFHQIVTDYVKNLPWLSDYAAISVEGRPAYFSKQCSDYFKLFEQHESIPSYRTDQALSKNLLTDLPKRILKHLDRECADGYTTPIWKFINWFTSIFQTKKPFPAAVFDEDKGNPKEHNVPNKDLGVSL